MPLSIEHKCEQVVISDANTKTRSASDDEDKIFEELVREGILVKCPCLDCPTYMEKFPLEFRLKCQQCETEFCSKCSTVFSDKGCACEP